MPAGLIATVLLLSACSSTYKGIECRGEIKRLSGQPLGETQALIIDHFSSFTVTTAGQTVNSGMLHSADRTQYIPSAMTREGFLAQRLSDKRFSIVDAAGDRWTTYTCP
ncbi:hypothetical protein FCN80_04075 [Martelella alba]|uniref:Uncharacterized protein n=1 Tax=Martelella alba TaxID=2590451 RepID=A0ABY2SQW7_9HYPH|nr:hypothetical protein FCN80_04075 [Martelella alba]